MVNCLPGSACYFTGKLDVLNLCNALKEVSDWYRMGIALGIPPYELRRIEQDYQGSDRQKTETLDLWLRLDTNATWSNVVSALQKINEHAVAKRVHQNYIAGPASKYGFLSYSRFCIRPTTIIICTSLSFCNNCRILLSPQVQQFHLPVV